MIARIICRKIVKKNCAQLNVRDRLVQNAQKNKKTSPILGDFSQKIELIWSE